MNTKKVTAIFLLIMFFICASCKHREKIIIEEGQKDSISINSLSGILYYCDEVPWMFTLFGAWTPDVFPTIEGAVRKIQLPDSTAFDLYMRADSTHLSNAIDKSSFDTRYEILFQDSVGDPLDTLAFTGGVAGTALFKGTQFKDSCLLQRIINTIMEKDSIWAKNYNDYFYDGKQQFIKRTR
ncbi:MAG: hypothetical protein IJ202_01120 [Bacteroidales bacterium]|nr:hypothetical protein [Bacteroidales bacterium]